MTVSDFDLDAKYRQTEGTILLTGIQALIRVTLDQHRADAARGLRTATFISGYQGSPLGTLDLTIKRMLPLLAEHDIRWQPGINEDLAATAVWGTQQRALGRLARHDGVLGMWYGKGPGVDRCGDVFKHANFMGVTDNGGVLAVGGDDPSAKSSTLPTDSNPTFYDALMPILYPGTIQEVLDLGLHGYALSRYSGLWAGLKIVTNIADGLATADVGPDRIVPVDPGLLIDGQPWRHVQRDGLLAPISLEQEKEIFYGRLEAAKAYAAANGVNRIGGATGSAWLGIAASGRTYHEVLQALSDLGLTEDDLRDHGVRLLRLGMIFPLEPSIVRTFASGLEEILVIEEKRPFVEMFVRDILYPLAERPRVVGKQDADGRLLVPADGELTADRLAPLLARRLSARLSSSALEARLALLESAAASVHDPLVARKPFFCSGCPHNRSTQLPEGSVVGGGVGCHAMVLWMDRDAVSISHMGGEGAQWIGRAPFTDRPHMFQNIGDGTFFHSGSLSIRAAVAAGVNITYKLLYNAAVAMTGGQDVEGVIPIPELTRALAAEGTTRIIVCSDDPEKFGRDANWAPGSDVWARDRLDEAQRVLRDTPGVTVIIYDQQCAAEKRRDRKRGQLATPTTRIFINEAVCEGCGDCGEKSNCLSVHPVETELGPKTQIHQASCNFDYTCVEGDCPSFLEVDISAVTQREPADRRAPDIELVEPAERPGVDGSFSVVMAGVGGTGVVTVSQVLATAALLDGFDVAALDQTGLSQKGGPVVSHVRITEERDEGVPAIGVGHADCYLAFDLVVAADPKHLVRTLPDRTLAVVSTSHVPTGQQVSHPQTPFTDHDELAAAIARSTRKDDNVWFDANALSEQLFGSHMQANMLVLGAAYQAGGLPVTAAAVERAIELNGAAVEANTQAFRWGRALVIDPAYGAAGRHRRAGSLALRATPEAQARAASLVHNVALPAEVAALAELRAGELIDYQSERLAKSYLDLVARTARREAQVAPGQHRLADAVARYYFKLLAYKDEYEVARLHLRPELDEAVVATFGEGTRASIQLHPPFLRALGWKRKIGFGPRSAPALKTLRSMRRVRGTPFDPFGRTAIRRLERELPEEYRTMIDEELSTLSPDTYERAVALATLPDVVRGYEEIKLRNVERYRAEVTRLRGSAD